MLMRRMLVVSIPATVLLIIAIGLQALVVAAGGPTAASATPTIIALSPIADTSLYDEDDLLSNGQGEYFFAGATQNGELRRGLLKFDVAGIVPVTALIMSATLQVHVSKHPPVHNPETFSLHRVTAEWGEGTSDAGEPGGFGATATEGDATWTFSYFSPTPTDRLTWTMPGGDFLPSASVSTVVDLQNQYYAWGSTSGMIADLRHWLASPDQNHGWIVLGNESDDWTARRFDSRENAVEEQRPVLYIEYLDLAHRNFLPLIRGQ